MKSKMKIRKGDTVQIITGKRDDKGKRGEVIKVLPKNKRVVIQGLNMRKKHQRQQQMEGRTLETGIIEFEAPIDLSNVMLVCPSCNEITRVGTSRDEDGEPFRVCRSCEAEIE